MAKARRRPSAHGAARGERDAPRIRPARGRRAARERAHARVRRGPRLSRARRPRGRGASRRFACAALNSAAMKILFATDGSPAALAALESLLRHESWFAARPELTLAHVHPAIPYGMATGWVGRKTVNDFYAEESAKALQPAREALDRSGIAYTVETRVGDPA